MADPIKSTIEYGRELFAHLDEFFLRATGMSPGNFATVENFDVAIRANARAGAPRLLAALQWLDRNVRPFYASRGAKAFEDAKQLGGMNLVLGGSSRFLATQLNSVSTAVLYSDTVLIPDPVMPWLEDDRREEEFRHVLLLQAVHTLLQLKPLVDAGLRYPPVVVFPSWERSLETGDAQTQQEMIQLLVDVLSNSLGETLVSIEDVTDYADRNSETFCDGVDRNHLFVAPNGPLNEPLVDALSRYEADIEARRTEEWLQAYRRLPTHRKVLTGIMERIRPTYHLLENAQELGGHPLMCIEQQAHYFSLVSRTSSARLERLEVLDPKTTAMVQALSSRRLRWLGGLPAEILAQLRLDNENVSFRERLAACVERLHQSVLDDVDQVTAEVCHELEAAIAEHEQDLRSIQEKYHRAHGETAVLAIAAGAALLPALAPLLGSVAPLALATKYGLDKRRELAEKRDLMRSLIGVLAVAQEDN